MKKLYKLTDILSSPFFMGSYIFVMYFFSMTLFTFNLTFKLFVSLLLWVLFFLGYWPLVIYEYVRPRVHFKSYKHRFLLGVFIWWPFLLLNSVFMIYIFKFDSLVILPVLYSNIVMFFLTLFAAVLFIFKLNLNLCGIAVALVYTYAVEVVIHFDTSLLIFLLLLLAALYTFFVRYYRMATNGKLLMSFFIGIFSALLVLLFLIVL